MLLTRLFDFIIGENPELQNKSYVLYDRVMNPLAAQLERKPRRDHGTRRGRLSTSSSTFDQPSSSHLNDDDDDGIRTKAIRGSSIGVWVLHDDHESRCVPCSGGGYWGSGFSLGQRFGSH
ncbi:hypothetical protein Tco_0105908 [Tanacetum coccineum]